MMMKCAPFILQKLSKLRNPQLWKWLICLSEIEDLACLSIDLYAINMLLIKSYGHITIHVIWSIQGSFQNLRDNWKSRIDLFFLLC